MDCWKLQNFLERLSFLLSDGATSLAGLARGSRQFLAIGRLGGHTGDLKGNGKTRPFQHIVGKLEDVCRIGALREYMARMLSATAGSTR